MGKGAKVALAIIIIIVGLFGMAYYGAMINEDTKEVDRLKAQAQQEAMQIHELKQRLSELNK